MNKKELEKKWLEEERIAHIKGWDFSHIQDRFEEENALPWNYREMVLKYIKPESRLLDIDTAGGELLLSLKHSNKLTSATEAYPPNVQLCKATLLPLGIDFHEADGKGILPFEDETFDVVINRHGGYNPDEIYRILKPGGVFITQQVGARNDRELVELLYSDAPALPYPDQYLRIAVDRFEKSGFSIIEKKEAFPLIRFYDVAALVWFARVIEWEFPDFTVKDNLDHLFSAQEKLEKEGVIEGKSHRFFFVAQK